MATPVFYASYYKITPKMRPGLRVCNNAVQGNHNLPLSCSVSIKILLSYTAERVSVNGSSATGNCSTFSSTHNRLSRCDAPTSSVLFDGNIPTLTGLDGDMWASQLLTLQTTNEDRRDIIFDFTGSSNSQFRVGRVELVMFNCPDMGIALQNIRLLSATVISDALEPVSTFSVPITP